MAISRTITPVLQMAEKQHFFKRFEAGSIKCNLYKIHFKCDALKELRVSIFDIVQYSA